MSIDSDDQLLVAVLRGAAKLQPASWSGEVLERAAWHRVEPLLAAALVRASEGLPEPIADRFRTMLREQAVADLAATAQIERLTTAIAGAGCDALLVKGAAVAPLYPAPHFRPRLDTDVLIRAEDRHRVEAILLAQGFAAAPEALGEIGTGQSHWLAATSTAVDLHWRLFNAQAFARVLEFDEIWRDSTPSAVSGARVPSLQHQLIIDAVHRVAHHYDSPRLIWLYDLHLLIAALGSEGLEEAVAAVEARGAGAAVARGVLQAAAAFGPELPGPVAARLSALVPDRHQQVYVGRAPRRVDLLASDLTAQPDWGHRIRLLREHLFPPADYIRTTYGWPWILLPIAYVDRIVRGAPRWFRRPSSRL